MKGLLLCLILLITPFSVTANEASENIIDRLVTQIPILSEYETNSVSGSENGEGYNVLFTSETKASAQVTANQDGIILSYSLNVPNQNGEKRLPNVTKTQSSEIAIEFARSAASDIFSQLNTAVFTNTYNSTPSAGYNVRLARSVYGITYANDSVSVWVDSQTGNVTRYNRSWDSKLQFAPVEEIITQKQAEDSFKTNIALELRYNKKIENGKAIPYLVYVPANTGTIDAVTGNAINQQSHAVSNSYNEMIALYEKTSIAATVIEKDSATQEGLVSGREAQKYARQIAELKIDDNYTAEQAKYYKNTNDDYLMTLKFTKASYTTNVTLDAKTLSIVGFLNGAAAAKKSFALIDKAKTKVKTNNFLDKYMGDYKNELSSPQINVIENSEYSICVVIYERIVNGVPYKSNSAQFVVNSEGDIISMSFIWDKVEFEDATNVIKSNEAYNIFYNNVGMQLIYMRTRDNVAQLVYTVNPQVSAIISAKSGTLLSYDGKPAKSKKSLSYIGLEGHYAQAQATALADCDIFVSEGNVLLNARILQKDYIVLLSSISPDGMPIYEKNGGITDEELDMIYNDFITKGVLDKSEVNANGYITREDAVKYLLRVVGYRGVAELRGIFKMSFKDSSEILPSLHGYVALAKGLNLISGSDGYFYPTRDLNNADALVMIYNYLNRGSIK